MRHLWILVLLLCAPVSFGQLKLIPTPQEMEMSKGRFILKAGVEFDPSIAKFTRVTEPVAGKSDESYELEITPEQITIRANTEAGRFYAVQTLKQIVRANSDAGKTIPCCKITDWPALRYRVWQDDISRGPIPTMDFLKRQIRLLSELKYNAMTLYTEHVFKLKKHPTIAPEDGITAEQIKELTAYAKDYHVEVIGNFQSFGHMRKILTTPGYEQLGDNTWNISPAKEEAYKFLAECYAEVAPAYESALFDINCDEVILGKTGASKEMVEKLGIAEVYARHINRCCEMLRPYNKTAMMWGDIAVEHQDIVPKLPKDLIVLSWGYNAKENFDKAIEPFTKIGLRFMVCPGVSCWNCIFPDYKKAIVNISNYVRDGVKHGAIGMINTSWDDDGENFFNQTWYPFAWGAEVSWNPAMPSESMDANAAREARVKQFDAAYAPVFFGATDDAITLALLKLSTLRSNPAAGHLVNAKFWKLDAVDPEQAKRLYDDAKAIEAELVAAQNNAPLNADTIDSAIFACHRIQFMASAQTASLEQKLAGIEKLKTEYAQMWYRENRGWWLDKNLEKYDQLAQRLKTPATQPVP